MSGVGVTGEKEYGFTCGGGGGGGGDGVLIGGDRSCGGVKIINGDCGGGGGGGDAQTVGHVPHSLTHNRLVSGDSAVVTNSSALA